LNPREQGFLLLTSHLGDPERKPLTVAQFRNLTLRMRSMAPTSDARPLRESDLVELGYGRDMAGRIVSLLEDTQLLDYYLRQGEKRGCTPITRVSGQYPLILRQRLGLDSPGCLWAKGDPALLSRPAISLVGSRELGPDNRAFAEAVGRQAARMGLVLVSGNARGADRAAQDACLEAGGNVIAIVADVLGEHKPEKGMLFLSENSYDEGFSAQRALQRNRCIHALGRITFVAQAELEKGGTWDGTVKNLRFGWSTVACFRDGSAASRELEQLGAYLIDQRDLEDFDGLLTEEIRLF